MKSTLLAAAALFALAGTTAHAIPSAPSLKPRLAFDSQLISEADFNLLSEGLDAADNGQWSTVRRLKNRINDDDARRLLSWRIATTASANPTFAELSSALTTLGDWPKMSTTKKLAEKALSSSGLSYAQKREWLEANSPATGEGKLELANLLRNSGNTREADALVKEIWRSHSLSSRSTNALLKDHSRLLTRSDHAERVEMLIWTGQRSEARRLLSRLSNSDRKLAEARLALIEGRRGVDRTIKAVPASRQADAGLLHDRARWRRRKTRNYDGAIDLLLQLDSADAVPAGRVRIWKERRILLRTLIKEQRWKDAYRLSANHNLTNGVSFAEAEFYAGWIALKHLNDASTALEHFESLAAGVGSPISVSRAHYWRGEALTALSRQEDAESAYIAAADHIFTFYGQLAAERLRKSGTDKAYLSFESVGLPTEQQRLAFESKPVVRAAVLLAEAGRVRDFERFSFHIDDGLKTPEEHQMLFDIAWDFLQPRSGIRGAKSGLSKGLVAPNAAFPIVELPDSPASGIAEDALILALSRQESELTPTAISHANARGMMQIIPATARNTARRSGMPYRTSWLTDDPTYNMRLGRSYLDGLIEQFNGSYIMALAAYNAGPSRPERWITEYGDPRQTGVDPVDWIESIPFSETRNYVQRIMENLQVYRHRLANEPVQIQLSDDLKRGMPDR